MRVARFRARVAGAKLNEADKKWFPRWIRSYASSLKITEGDLRVTEADVIAFSRSLRDNKTPAWQRLQAVRAVEAYRDLVLRSDDQTSPRKDWDRHLATDRISGVLATSARSQPH